MKNLAVCALLVVASSGCSNFTIRHFNPDPLPEADSHTKELKSYFLKAAGAAQNAQITLLSTASEKDAYRATMLAYFDAAVALSNDICNTWFGISFLADREANHTKTLTNIIGNTTVGILGFTGAEAKQLGILGLSLAGINSEFDNYMAYFLISTSLPDIKDKLDEGRDDYAQKFRHYIATEKIEKLTFGAVATGVSQYHNLCSRLEIQKIVQRSVARSEYKSVSLDDAQLKTNLQAIHKQVAGTDGALTNETAIAMYVWERVKTLGPDYLNQFQTLYENDPVIKDWIAKLKAKDNGPLDSLILETGEFLNAEEKVQELVSAIPGAPPSPAKPPPEKKPVTPPRPPSIL